MYFKTISMNHFFLSEKVRAFSKLNLKHLTSNTLWELIPFISLLNFHFDQKYFPKTVSLMRLSGSTSILVALCAFPTITTQLKVIARNTTTIKYDNVLCSIMMMLMVMVTKSPRPVAFAVNSPGMARPGQLSPNPNGCVLD